MNSAKQQYIPLVNMDGKFVGLVPVKPLPIDRSKPAKAPVLAHLILVIDRSGSMYSDMRAMRETVKQVLTLHDFHDAELEVTLISYSSQGDTTTHFVRIKVGDIMKTGSAQQKEIDRLEATMLTCISGGLEVAEKQIKVGEPTCILLHSDGYANHPSPSIDQRRIDEIIGRLSKNPGIVVNTIVYSWGDFSLLDGIAARCGGTCIRATSAKDVYKAVHASVALMAGKQQPAIKLEGQGTIFAVSKSARKVMVGDGELFLRGLSDKDDVTAYLAGEQIKPRALESGEEVDPEVILSFARVELATSHLNTAKRLVLASRDSSLYPHRRALTRPQIADFATALETAIFDGKHSYVEKYGISSDKPTVAEVVNLLNANKTGYQVNMDLLMEKYNRRGLKRVAGSREKDGTVIPPRTKTASKRTEWKSVSGFNMNRSSATINMLVHAEQTLHDIKTGAQISEVKGVPLNLTEFRNYTIVGDGNVNVPVLRIRVTDKRLAKQLDQRGFKADSNNIVDINLSELDVVPATDVGAELVADSDIVSKLIALRTISSMMSASIKGQSTKYTADQVAALKEVHVTPAMNASIPTMSAFPDEDEAIRKGWIDSYTTFKIEIGNAKMPLLSESLYGANEFMKRHYELKRAGAKIEKPTMLEAVDPDVTVTEKKPKTPDAADEVQKPYFDQFLGIASKGPWNDFLATMGLEEDEVKEFLDWRKLSVDRRVEVFETISKKVGEFSDLLFSQVLAPTVIFMGATGFLPDAIEATILDADAFCEKYKVKKVKALEEATFFILQDGRVLSVRSEVAKFTTPAGIAAIKDEVMDAA